MRILIRLSAIVILLPKRSTRAMWMVVCAAEIAWRAGDSTRYGSFAPVESSDEPPLQLFILMILSPKPGFAADQTNCRKKIDLHSDTAAGAGPHQG